MIISSWVHEYGLPGVDDRAFGVGAVRREHLPSWTWAGWKGPITWGALGGVHAFLSAAASAETGSHKGAAVVVYSPEMVLSNGSTGISLRLSELNAVDKLPADGRYLLSIPNAFVLDCRRIKAEGSSINVLGNVRFSGELRLSPRLSAAEVVAGWKVKNLPLF